MNKTVPKSVSLTLKILAISFAVSVILIFNSYFHMLPISQSATYIALLPLFALCVNLGFSMLRYFTGFLKKGIVFYLFQWTFTLILPVLFISLIELSIQKIIMRSVVSQLSPTIRYIDSYQEKNGSLPLKLGMKIKADNLSYYHNKKAYMLKTEVTSVDKKGETIFYDSRTKHWYRFHKNQFDYFKDKKVMPPNIKSYIWFMKNTK